MQTTLAQLALSPVYRHAQRTLAPWLEPGHGAARQLAFRARAAIGRLDAADRHRLARWLAWLLVVEQSRGRAALEARLRQLDGALHRSMQEALKRLPTAAKALTASRRLSA
jgi:glycosyltransferase A (GT-A) superfamily protein (DUF2064 family)